MDYAPKLAQVVNVMGRTGSRGQVTQVRVKFLDASERQIMRSVKGPIRKGDIITLVRVREESQEDSLIY